MKHILVRMRVLFVMLICVLLLAACGGASEPPVVDPPAPENLTEASARSLMAAAHRQYNTIHAIYEVSSADQVRLHAVWLDRVEALLRYEVRDGDGNLQEVRVRNGDFLFTNAITDDAPMRSMARPVDPETMPVANQMLGGIGTLISPLVLVEGRLSESQIVVGEVMDFSVDGQDAPLSVVELSTQLQDFPADTLWVDQATGIIVKEILFNEGATVRTETTLQFLELNPTLDETLFTVTEADESIGQ